MLPSGSQSKRLETDQNTHRSLSNLKNQKNAVKKKDPPFDIKVYEEYYKNNGRSASQ